jgi:predicted ribosomally synthesized peptide with SipW-like signal peptide
MNKKATRVLLSSIVTVAVSASIVIGSTYALFTDSSSVNIAVTSGNVEVEATISDIQAYSIEPYNKVSEEQFAADREANGEVYHDYNNQYAYKAIIANEDKTSTFTNGGTVKYDTTENTFTLDNVSPGDKVTFNINITNKSNVDIKYRTAIKYTTESGLLNDLYFTLDGWVPVSSSIINYDKTSDSNTVDMSMTQSINSFWAEWSADDQSDTKVISATIELPLDTSSDFMDKKVEVVYSVEAVQGNAATSGSESQSFFINSANGLRSALAVGGNVNVYKNIALTQSQVKVNNKLTDSGFAVEITKNSTTLNADSVSLSFADDNSDATSLISFANSTDKKQLIIKGDGTYDATNTDAVILNVSNNSTALITDGIFTARKAVANIEDGSRLIITGGTFESEEAAQLFTFGTLSDATATSDDEEKSTSLIIAGGTFVNYEPASKYIKDGYEVVSTKVSNDIYYTVVSSSSTVGDDVETVTYTGQTTDSISLAEKLVIDSSVTSIKESAFANNYPLVKVIEFKSTSLSSIGQSAFAGFVSLEKLDLSSTSVTNIGYGAFSDCYSLKEVTLPEGLKSLGGASFLNCYSLESVVIPNNVTIINGRTFGNCYSLKSVTIPNSVETIDVYAFSSCTSLESLKLPDSLTKIGAFAFNGCTALTQLVMPDSLETVNFNAFNRCKKLTSFSFGSNLKTLGYNVFEDSGVTSITLNYNNSLIIDAYVFTGIKQACSVVINVTGDYTQYDLVANDNVTVEYKSLV